MSSFQNLIRLLCNVGEFNEDDAEFAKNFHLNTSLVDDEMVVQGKTYR